MDILQVETLFGQKIVVEFVMTLIDFLLYLVGEILESGDPSLAIMTTLTVGILVSVFTTFYKMMNFRSSGDLKSGESTPPEYWSVIATLLAVNFMHSSLNVAILIYCIIRYL